jgi:hypothetical protein
MRAFAGSSGPVNIHCGRVLQGMRVCAAGRGAEKRPARTAGPDRRPGPPAVAHEHEAVSARAWPPAVESRAREGGGGSAGQREPATHGQALARASSAPSARARQQGLAKAASEGARDGGKGGVRERERERGKEGERGTDMKEGRE